MIFLIEYDRRRGRLLTFKPFPDADLEAAQRARLELELKCAGANDSSEIVLLQAESEAAVRRTHRRYFQTAREIIESSTSG